MNYFNDDTGNITSLINSQLISTEQMGSVGIEITGVWVGVLQFEFTIDGQTYHPIKDQFNGSWQTSTANNGSFQFNVSGLKAIRVRASSFTSGTAVVTSHADEATGIGVGAMDSLPQPFTDFGTAVAFTVDPQVASSLLSFTATNINAAIRYVQFFNSSTIPTSGQVPVFSFTLPAGTATVPSIFTLSQDWLSLYGFSFPNGLTIAFSTSAGSYTAATASDHTIQGTYLGGTFSATPSVINVTDSTAPADSIGSIVTGYVVLPAADHTTPADSVVVSIPANYVVTLDSTAPAESFLMIVNYYVSVADSTAPSDVIGTLVIANDISVSDSTAPADAVTVTQR